MEKKAIAKRYLKVKNRYGLFPSFLLYELCSSVPSCIPQGWFVLDFLASLPIDLFVLAFNIDESVSNKYGNGCRHLPHHCVALPLLHICLQPSPPLRRPRPPPRAFESAMGNPEEVCSTTSSALHAAAKHRCRRLKFTGFLKLIRLFFILVLYCHWMACLWFLVPQLDPDSDNWLSYGSPVRPFLDTQ